jgi:hypothetical protein
VNRLRAGRYAKPGAAEKVFGRLAREVRVTAGACFLYELVACRRSTFTSHPLAHSMLAVVTWYVVCYGNRCAILGTVPASFRCRVS